MYLQMFDIDSCVFTGSYVATSTSVIGALQKNLRINVLSLSASPQEDLRKTNFCWISKTLPASKPYR